MSTETADHFAPARTAPGRIGQGTEIEKARAATQVQAAVYIARQFPRDPARAHAQMQEACKDPDLAEEAFYEYPRGDTLVRGLTIVAACEIAQIWGNLEYGLNELRRDDVYGQSEMLAFAWDLETNVRPTQLFVAPHVRDTKKGSYRVKDVRDISEVTTNLGNRRMRGCLIKIMPRSYVLAAEAALQATLMRSIDIGEPLDKQVKKMTDAFIQAWGVTRAQLESKSGRPFDKWTPRDLVDLKILSKSLARRDMSVEDAFPAHRVTADELPEAPASGRPAEPEPTRDDPFDGPSEFDHINHGEGEYDPWCPGCRRESLEADQKAADQ